MENYQKPQSKTGKHTDETVLFDEKQAQFEKIIILQSPIFKFIHYQPIFIVNIYVKD